MDLTWYLYIPTTKSTYLRRLAVSDSYFKANKKNRASRLNYQSHPTYNGWMQWKDVI